MDMDRQRFDELIAQSRYQAIHLVDRIEQLASKGDMEERVLESVKYQLVDELMRSDKIKLQQTHHGEKSGGVLEYKAEFFVFSHDELKVLLEMARRL